MSLSEAQLDPPQQVSAAKIILDNLEELVAVGLLCIVGASLSLQVFMRTVFSAPLSWPEELSQFLFVWASVLGTVGAAKRFGLVRVESIVERLPGWARKLTDRLTLILAALVLCVLGWQGLQMALRSTYAAATLPITWSWMYSAATAFALLLYARLLQTQVFKYRFTFLELVLAGDRTSAGSDGSGT